MANLIPLNIDKDTGKIVARGSAVGQRIVASGFLFEQIVASSTWNIPHDRKNDRVVVQVFDDVGEKVEPDTTDIIDINNIQITFGAPMSGTAHIIFFENTL